MPPKILTRAKCGSYNLLHQPTVLRWGWGDISHPLLLDLVTLKAALRKFRWFNMMVFHIQPKVLEVYFFCKFKTHIFQNFIVLKRVYMFIYTSKSFKTFWIKNFFFPMGLAGWVCVLGRDRAHIPNAMLLFSNKEVGVSTPGSRSGFWLYPSWHHE